jgi:hypothetical protein
MNAEAYTAVVGLLIAVIGLVSMVIRGQHNADEHLRHHLDT